MKITSENLDDVTLLVLSGRLDALSEGGLKDEVNGLVEGGRINIAVNMEDVNFIDSSGLGALISSLRTARDSGGDLRVCSLTEQVSMVFQVMRLNKVFKIFDTKEDALRSF